jgi:hypothetical protein
MDLLRLLLGDRCCVMHRHGYRCSMLHGWHWGGNWCWGWDSGSRDGSARLVLLLRVLGLRVCWGKVVVDWIVLLDLGLNVLRVCVLVVCGFVDHHMRRLQLGAQTAGRSTRCRTGGQHRPSECRPIMHYVTHNPLTATAAERNIDCNCC